MKKIEKADNAACGCFLYTAMSVGKIQKVEHYLLVDTGVGCC